MLERTIPSRSKIIKCTTGRLKYRLGMFSLKVNNSKKLNKYSLMYIFYDQTYYFD